MSGFIVGIIKVCPTLSKLDVKLFAALSSFTVIPYLLAMLYKLSPDTIFM